MPDMPSHVLNFRTAFPVPIPVCAQCACVYSAMCASAVQSRSCVSVLVAGLLLR